MKTALALAIGFGIGCVAATAFWYIQLYVPSYEQDIRVMEAEATLLRVYADRLQSGELDETISTLRQWADERSESAHQLKEARVK